MFFFKNKSSDLSAPFVTTDMHSHLLPGIDDGAPDIDISVQLAQSLYALGYRKLILTPHIMGDFYKNTPEIINHALHVLQTALIDNHIDLKLEAAAEYYLDDYFMDLIKNHPEQLLSFGDRYILFEMPFMNSAPMWKEAVFNLQSLGFKPILAHPERYIYLIDQPNLLQEILDRNILLQINLNSLTGYYSKGAQKFAEKLIDQKQVHFVGTDCHHANHIELLYQVQKLKYYRKLSQLALLNQQL